MQKHVRKLNHGLLLLCLSGVSNTAIGSVQNQSVPVTLDLKNTTIENALNQIEDNTDYQFVYNRELIDVNRKINIVIKNKEISNVLDALFNKNVSYAINGNHVILSRKTETTETVVQQKRIITGKVVDDMGEPLPGATIMVAKSTRGVSTDLDGTFSIEVSPSETLIFSYVGMDDQKIVITDQKSLLVKLENKKSELEEVTVVAFAKQKKESVIASIDAINPKELKVPSSNLTTGLAGRIAGLISYQTSGEPGADNSQFFIRGVTSFGYSKGPLILLDGFEITQNDLARVEPDNIASFSIMKDATATALYGARGANGIIMVNTKEGTEGKTSVTFRHESSFSTPTHTNEFSSGVEYMNLYNEAQYNDNPMMPAYYSAQKIENTQRGLNPYAYPDIDWYDELFNKHGYNHRYNLNISGGGKKARYYLSASYNRDNGILKVDQRNNFNNNIQIDRYNIQTNVNLNLTKTTEINFKMNAQFEQYNGPKDSGNRVFETVMEANPVDFPKYFLPDESTQYSGHILFGTRPEGKSLNPYAEMVRGYKDSFSSKFLAQVQLRQDLDFITKGLSFRAKASVQSYGSYSSVRMYDPYYYALKNYNQITDKYTIENIVTGTNSLGNPVIGKDANNRLYFEFAAEYNRNFGKNDLNGLLVYTQNERLNTNPGNTIFETLPSRNMGLAGRLSYSYDRRYMAEFNFGYNGSERFHKNNQFGFFPSIGLAYVISNESFWSDLSTWIPTLKLKYTYGKIGNDDIADEKDRFFYLSEVVSNMANGTIWGNDFLNHTPGYNITRYANPKVTWEVAYKQNLGFEANILRAIEVNFDLFKERRENIYQRREYLPASMGLSAVISGNTGIVESKGMDWSIDVNHSFNKDFWVSARVNFTYATNKIIKMDEKVFKYDYLYRKGHSVDQQWGWVAERLFIDDEEVANSPVQTMGSYGAGDIKYKDINDDGVIDDNDRIPIGTPSKPEIIYGFGPSVGFKGFDFSFFMQGSGRSSFFVQPAKIAPFVKNHNVLKEIADNHWTPKNSNVNAFWPKLSLTEKENNTRNSTWWLRDQKFLRLKSVELGYSFQRPVLSKLYLSQLRVYVSGTNLLTFSDFDLWDPEMGGDGLKYPLQKVYNVGIQIGF
ncbi:MAG: TonB-dependent receptor [Bacteroidales bacterium]